MSTVRVVYHPRNGQPHQPKFPATDQHPNAVRYLVGGYYVDAIGGEPTESEVQAVLNPPKQPSREDALDALLAEQAKRADAPQAVKDYAAELTQGE